MITTINPATEQIIDQYSEMPFDEVAGLIDKAELAFQAWRKTSFKARAKCLLQAAEILRKNKQDYAKLITTEMGKPITQSLSEIEKCAWCCQHYAEHGQDYLTDQPIQTKARKSYVTYQPLGLVFAIMPWNFPFWQVFRFACPTLMAGNGALLSHAPISTGTGIVIEAIFKEAGFPEYLFTNLVISNETAAKVIAHQHIAAVTLTGSEQAGRVVGKSAAANLKKIVLELGGSDPYIVCDDADLDLAVSQIIASRMNNAGQVCIAAKRIIATKKIFHKLQQKILAELDKFTLGDPLLSSTKIGPMARKDLRDILHQQVQLSLLQGAKLLAGGVMPNQRGFYYPATVLTEVRPGMAAFDEELFGPVIVMVEAANLPNAIELANQTKYGLAAAIFTTDILLAEQIAKNELQAGACFINQMVGSDPRLPFGGIKASGYGRELAEEGIKAFVNIKTVVVS